jgi:hypothetical protein
MMLTIKAKQKSITAINEEQTSCPFWEDVPTIETTDYNAAPP